MKITVIDYQLGNISSIINMIKKIGVTVTHSSDIHTIRDADKLILPGVGAFDHGMQNLQQAGLIEILHEEVLVRKKPILGICLGMQLLLNQSEEGKLKGLGWIKGECRKFKFSNKPQLKVPHMGWNNVRENKKNALLSLEADQRFYFVHSYHAICEDNEDVVGVTEYGYEFASVIKHQHIIGAQFHPEKSHRYGMAFLEKFIRSSS